MGRIWCREPARLDRRADRRPRRRHRGRRGAGARPGPGRGTQRGPTGGADHDVPARVRRRRPGRGPRADRGAGCPRAAAGRELGPARRRARPGRRRTTRSPTTPPSTTPATSATPSSTTESWGPISRVGGMRAVIATEPGGPEVLSVTELPDPEIGPGEVLLDVAAAGLNRADLLQRQGFYPPPPGASEVIGMECSGTVAALGLGRDRLVRRRPGVRTARRGRVRRAGRRTGGTADADPGRGRPGHRGGDPRGGGHGVVQRLHGRRAAAAGDAAGARRRGRHRVVRDPARAPPRRPGDHHRRDRREARRAARRSAPT